MDEGAHERVLCDLFCACRVARHHQRETEHPALVQPDDRRVRVAITAPDRQHGGSNDWSGGILAHAPGFVRSASSSRPNPIDAYTSFRTP